MMDKTDIRSMEYEELKGFVKALGEPLFRAKQMFEWMHVKLVDDIELMTNLPLTFRKELEEKVTLKKIVIEDVKASDSDESRKYLFRLEDGAFIESVMLRYEHGVSVCVSSQVGCDMGCRFCASTVGGCERNLSASEMLAQVYSIQKDMGLRVSHVVVMGMGEPMLNYDNLIKFIRIVSSENALHISQRNITISTCGIVPGIRRMAEESLKVTLALSLHAPNDDIRRSIMPVANRYPMGEVLDSCRYYFEQTGRRITFEYCMIKDVNDSKDHARELSDLVKGMGVHINLIPMNETRDNGLCESSKKNIDSFMETLDKANINVTKRRSMGRETGGACGQLARRKS